MKSELERHREAIVVALTALADLSGADNRAYTGRRCTDACDQINAILNPPPEMEEVEETVGWVNVWQDKDGAPARVGVYTYRTKDAADDAANGCNDATRIDCQEIKVKVQRPKPQPVVRSAPIVLTVGGWSLDSAIKGDGPWYGTFTWQE